MNAQDRVLEISTWIASEDRLVPGEALDLACDGKRQPRPGGTARDGGRRGEGGLGHEGDGLAVVDDVGDLIGTQVPVDGRHPCANTHDRLIGLDEFGTIPDEKRDTVAGVDPAGPERAGQPVDASVELAEVAPTGG